MTIFCPVLGQLAINSTTCFFKSSSEILLLVCLTDNWYWVILFQIVRWHCSNFFNCEMFVKHISVAVHWERKIFHRFGLAKNRYVAHVMQHLKVKISPLLVAVVCTQQIWTKHGQCNAIAVQLVGDTITVGWYYQNI